MQSYSARWNDAEALCSEELCLGSCTVWCQDHQVPFLGRAQWTRGIIDLDEGVQRAGCCWVAYSEKVGLNLSNDVEDKWAYPGDGGDVVSKVTFIVIDDPQICLIESDCGSLKNILKR